MTISWTISDVTREMDFSLLGGGLIWIFSYGGVIILFVVHKDITDYDSMDSVYQYYFLNSLND